MVVFPNIKLNLGLRVVARRPDGYHDLETGFLTVPGCADVLEAVPAPAGQPTRLHLSGIPIPGDPAQNLVLKAYHILASRYTLPTLDVYLRKAIPAGTGVGAGSSDAAFALKLFAGFAPTPVPIADLEALALELGSDCPVFIQNRPAIGRGRGERLKPVTLPLSGYGVRIRFDPAHISTAQAFAGIVPTPPAEPIETTLARPIAEWQAHLHNDFERTVFAAQPVLARHKAALQAEGAVYAALSGTGSAVFGLFEPTSAAQWEPGWLPDGDVRTWQGVIQL